MDLPQLLALSLQMSASDLHLSTGLPPFVRVDGDLRKLALPILTQQAMSTLLEPYIKLEHPVDSDFAVEIATLGRFRVNVFQQARGLACVWRIIPQILPTVEALQLPARFHALTHLSHGLVLFAGPTGSGKSTTMAALIHAMNQQRQAHILTLEDPIEFVHVSQQCLIHQREIHRDTANFTVALRAALREDPDVIMVGELRDLETIRLAMTAAETGHLVFATLHAQATTKAIHRIIDVFPGDERAQIRSLLSEVLHAVIAQQLVKKTTGGRIALCEVMLCNAAIRHLIREDKIAQMYSVLQTGQAQGMFTFDQHLAQLVSAKLIAPDNFSAMQSVG